MSRVPQEPARMRGHRSATPCPLRSAIRRALHQIAAVAVGCSRKVKANAIVHSRRHDQHRKIPRFVRKARTSRIVVSTHTMRLNIHAVQETIAQPHRVIIPAQGQAGHAVNRESWSKKILLRVTEQDQLEVTEQGGCPAGLILLAAPFDSLTRFPIAFGNFPIGRQRAGGSSIMSPQQH